MGKVVASNPFLGGKLIKRKEDDVVVEAHWHDNFVVEIDGPPDFHPPVDSLAGKIEAIQRDLEPAFAGSTIGHPLESGGPLFRVIVMRWRDEPTTALAAYMVELSHLIGDGATYYKVIGLLDDAINGRASAAGLKLDWVPAPLSVPYPDSYTKADTDLFMFGWVDGYLAKCDTYKTRDATVRLLSKEAAEALKGEFTPAAKAAGIPFLSTNDLITAAFCDVHRNASEDTICLMFANLRGRLECAADKNAGNYERGVAFPCAHAAAAPLAIRRMGKSWQYYAADGRAHAADEGCDEGRRTTKAIKAMDLMVVTNWSSLTRFIEPMGCTVECHCAGAAFVTGLLGIDMYVVFKADSSGALALLTNTIDAKRGRELKEHFDSSALFKRLFPAPTQLAPPPVTDKEAVVPRGGPKGGAPVSGRNYLVAQGIEKKLTDAVAVVLKERPADAANRIAELLTKK